jgi:hypothetical protein
MTDWQWPGRIDPDLPAVGMIEVAGTLEHPRDAASTQATKTFRNWLVARHDGAKVVVHNEFQPDSLGRAWVTVVPARPLAKDPGGLGTADQAGLLQREAEIIGRMWRKMVSWGH